MSIWVPIGIWVALFIATGVLALLLPRETMGRDIDEVDEDNVALGSIEMMGDEEMDRQ